MNTGFIILTNELNDLASCQIGFSGKSSFDRYTVGQNTEKDPENGVIKQINTVTNTSDKAITVNRLSSVYADGIAKGFYEKDILIHLCHFAWQGEAQWVTKTPLEMGLYPVAAHEVCRGGRSVSSVGSWSTERYYPIVLIEDKTDNVTYFFEHQGGTSWEIELGTKGAPDALELTVEVNSLHESRTGTYVTLKAGESYTTLPVIYGEISGTADDALNTLLKYKRKNGRSLTEPLVCFNDYMNCDWSKPTEERLLPLIDAAAEVGAEVFCIDDGWAEQGVWLPLEEKYPRLGLQGVISYIREKGMTAGIWFEFERASLETAEKIGAEDFLLKRDGAVIAPTRPKLNMRSNSARAWLLERIDALYAMGIRYIKNDHNNDVGIGTNIQGETPAEGLRENTKAFYEFIDLLKVRYPDLTLENCASGSKRADNGTLKHFHLQSFSDQEDYRLNPSILIGQMAVMPPEKEGIWSYPYPQLFKDMKESTLSKEQLESHCDGRQTVFNMVSSMMGYMYLSGRIDLADANNKALIKEAIEVYKTYKDDICNCVPIFDLPMKGMQENDYRVLALKNEEKGEMLLAVWALEENEFTVALKELKNSRIQKLYPSAENVLFSHDGEKLCCRFEDKYSACLFKVSL